MMKGCELEEERKANKTGDQVATTDSGHTTEANKPSGDKRLEGCPAYHSQSVQPCYASYLSDWALNGLCTMTYTVVVCCRCRDFGLYIGDIMLKCDLSEKLHH